MICARCDQPISKGQATETVTVHAGTGAVGPIVRHKKCGALPPTSSIQTTYGRRTGR